ncbi:MAG: hypothetical protein WD512_12935 [Candidatus Paceibacterota bacterium]
MSIFKQFNNENVTLIKTNGDRYEDVEASVQSDMIFIEDTSLPVEEGDTFIRKLPNGLIEKYKVLDRGFHEKFSSMPAHYQVKVHKLSGIKQAKSGKTIYNLGDNSRVNINSNDSSINIINMESKHLFAEIKSKVEENIESQNERRELLLRLEELEKAQNTPSFSEKYADFMALAANHTTILTPYFPALTQLLVT